MPQKIALENGDLKVCWIIDLGKPFESKGQQNDYEIFKAVEDRYGVYIFVDGQSNILYVGESHEQALKDRITQNFTEDNTGGTFRKNWCNKNGNFTEFKEALKNWKILTISTSKENDDWIIPFEVVSIYILDPEHNNMIASSKKCDSRSILRRQERISDLFRYICTMIQELSSNNS